MEYTRVEVAVYPLDPHRDILCSLLANAGYESFEYTDNGVVAYIPTQDFDEDVFIEMEWPIQPVGSVSWEAKRIPIENWNRDWESKFPPVKINHRLRISAPFHELEEEFEFDLKIMPQMSFGTGHHPTTALLSRQILKMDVTGKDVLDMGCGTGVLGILAEKCGASSVLAVDIEAWACENTKENAQRNNCTKIDVIQGDSGVLQGRDFDVILANINRNVLLASMAELSDALRTNGNILFSGFYKSDVPAIVREAARFGLEFAESGSEEDWFFVHCIKSQGENDRS